MEQAALTSNQPSDVGDHADNGGEHRAAPRFTLLIRAAKLVSSQGEFVCVIRDVSSTGVSVRTFHDLPAAKDLKLELQSGAVHPISRVWKKPGEAGFEFAEPVDVEDLVTEAGRFPKRGLRLAITIPVRVVTLTQRVNATIHNISQQGARMESDALFAIDQTIRIEGDHMKEVRAKVRWRRENSYGLVFDDTYSMQDFALLAAALQCPDLIGD